MVQSRVEVVVDSKDIIERLLEACMAIKSLRNAKNTSSVINLVDSFRIDYTEAICMVNNMRKSNAQLRLYEICFAIERIYLSVVNDWI